MFYRDELPPHVQSCVRCYTSDWKVVRYLHRHYSSSVTTRACSPKHTLLHNSARQEFEVDFQSSSTDQSELGLFTFLLILILTFN